MIMNDSSIVVYVEYGSMHFDIKTMMKKRKMTKTQLARKSGLHHQIIDRYYNGNVTRFDKEVLAKLCYILDCSLNDILYYERPKKN